MSFFGLGPWAIIHGIAKLANTFIFVCFHHRYLREYKESFTLEDVMNTLGTVLADLCQKVSNCSPNLISALVMSVIWHTFINNLLELFTSFMYALMCETLYVLVV